MAAGFGGDTSPRNGCCKVIDIGARCYRYRYRPATTETAGKLHDESGGENGSALECANAVRRPRGANRPAVSQRCETNAYCLDRLANSLLFLLNLPGQCPQHAADRSAVGLHQSAAEPGGGCDGGAQCHHVFDGEQAASCRASPRVWIFPGLNAPSK